jgi:hypothetical protein
VPDIQEQLIRASAVARLGRIVQELERRKLIAAEERRWFAELLHPLAPNDSGSARLVSSSAVSRAEGGAMLEILQEYLLEHQDTDDLHKYIHLLGRLRSRLLAEDASLEEELVTPALEVARRLRSHFLGFETPTNPHVQLS